MKTLLLFLLLISINLLISAQNTTKIHCGYDWENGDWKLSDRQTITRDDSGRTVEYLREKINTTTEEWENYNRYSYAFDSIGNEVQTFSEAWDTINGVWDVLWGQRKNITYNSDGQILQQINEWWDTDINSFIFSDKLENSYNVEGQVTSMTYSYWDTLLDSWVYYSSSNYIYGINDSLEMEEYKVWNSISNSWNNNEVKYYFYTSNGLILEIRIETWNPQTSTWVLTNQSDYVYDSSYNLLNILSESRDFITNNPIYKGMSTYNSNENLVEHVSQLWNDSIGNWVNNYRELYTYNSNNIETESLKHYWDDSSNSWINSNIWISSFDENSNFLYSLEKWWNPNTNEWVNHEMYNSVYDTNGNEIQSGYYYGWDEQINDWETQLITYYTIGTDGVKADATDKYWSYQTNSFVNYHKTIYNTDGLCNPLSVEQNIEETSMSLYPNPASSQVNIVGASEYVLYDFLAKNILSGSSTTIDVSNLSNGIYFVQLTNENASKTEKLLIQR